MFSFKRLWYDKLTIDQDIHENRARMFYVIFWTLAHLQFFTAGLQTILCMISISLYFDNKYYKKIAALKQKRIQKSLHLTFIWIKRFRESTLNHDFSILTCMLIHIYFLINLQAKKRTNNGHLKTGPSVIGLFWIGYCNFEIDKRNSEPVKANSEFQTAELLQLGPSEYYQKLAN